jgi:hypothetical protein
MTNWWDQIQERLKYEERKLYCGEARQTPFVVEPLVSQILADIERSRNGSLRSVTGQINESGLVASRKVAE